MLARKFWSSIFRIYLAFITCAPELHPKWRFFCQPVITENKIVCTTPECKERAQMYLKNMVSSVNPCDDFYEYACGKWELQNPRPPYMQEWTVYSVLTTKAMHQTRGMLENELKRTPAGDLYQTCLNMPHLSRAKAEFLQKYLKGEYSLPVFHKADRAKIEQSTRWWMIDNHFVQISGESALFDACFKANTKTKNEPLLDLRDLHSPYGSLLSVTRWNTESMDNYKMFLYTLIQRIAPRNVQVTRTSIGKEIHKVIDFRKRIQKIIVAEDEETYYPYNPVTIKELQRWYDILTKKPGQIKWLHTIRSLYGETAGSKVHSGVIVNVNRKLYFVKLAELLDATSENTIISHIILYFLERHIEIDDALKSILNKIISQDDSSTGIIRYSPERWIYCIKNNNLRSTIGKQYVRKYLLEQNRQQVLRLIKDVQEIVEIDVSECTWLNGALKEMALEKIRSSQSWVGYPVWYNDPDSRKDYKEMQMNPTIANVNYAGKRNLFLVNAAVLQDPLYNSVLPPFVQAATMGFIIGHEQYHAFDDNNIFYDYKGIDRSLMWSKRTDKDYESRKSCFLKQYTAYRIKELDNTCKRAECNGALTYNENLADTMGLKTAYKLHRRMIKLNNGNCDVLPGFEHLNCDQMFFLAFANTLCGVIPKENLRRHLRFSAHSVPRLRVNGAIANLKAFKKAFKCKTLSVLNPFKRCDLWI
ncbi:hypothetical protein KM043_015074 [Ampulex compressa]|nr:hypothetical protein KM043_015074 [Ampulex compressa]